MVNPRTDGWTEKAFSHMIISYSGHVKVDLDFVSFHVEYTYLSATSPLFLKFKSISNPAWHQAGPILFYRHKKGQISQALDLFHGGVKVGAAASSFKPTLGAKVARQFFQISCLSFLSSCSQEEEEEEEEAKKRRSSHRLSSLSLPPFLASRFAKQGDFLLLALLSSNPSLDSCLGLLDLENKQGKASSTKADHREELHLALFKNRKKGHLFATQTLRQQPSSLLKGACSRRRLLDERRNEQGAIAEKKDRREKKSESEKIIPVHDKFHIDSQNF
ncbi:uncharacterized protein LOC116252622 [Nymphaea colorata]|uniref:uncharacterized protein LOC116252622 n=1 Tax=Nymphaea colorata TaxID=210225 RepID=UPI00129D990B|nr:uncharacterized protein LOC116252622 [Nymphaea colorata]